MLFPGGQYVGFSAARYIFDDLDGDGVKDFMVIDQGYESIENNPLTLPDLLAGQTVIDNNGNPWTNTVIHQGAPLIWWKGSIEGPYTSMLIDEGYLAFHHNGSAADIDLDGKKEIAIANSGSYLQVSDEAISLWLSFEKSDELLYGGVIHTRIPHSEILGAGHRPLIFLSISEETNNYELRFDLLPEDSVRQIMPNQNGGFGEMLSGITVEMHDINNDRYPDMILGVGHSYPGGPAENRIYLNTGGTFSASSPVLLPFPEIATNLENRNSAVFIDAADIDGNGLLDIAIGFENPGNGQGAGHFIQLWSQTSEMVFKDVTLEAIGSYDTQTFREMVSAPFGSKDTWGGGRSWLWFEDINSDGHLDIAMYTNMVGFYELGAGFLINDGSGNFSPIHYTSFSAPQKRNNIDYPDQASGNYTAVLGDFNGDGLIDKLVIEYENWGYIEDFPNSLRQPAYLYAYSEISESPFSLLANGYRVWHPDQIGFSEFYYSKAQPKAVASVEAGNYPNLYAYYLAEGRVNGDLPIAPQSFVWGTDKSFDTMYMPFDAQQYGITITQNENILITTDGAKTWELNSVERLMFMDHGLAFDIHDHAGEAVKTLGAFLGASGITPENVGLVLNLLDGGLTYEGLITEANAVVFGADPDGATMVRHFYTVLTGEEAPADVINQYGGMVDNGELSRVELAKLVADSEVNLTNIDLVGLSATGVEYLLG